MGDDENSLQLGGSQRNDLGRCRFYEREFPEKEETVMVKVVRVAEMGAYAQLLEYNNLDGMILMSELSKRRIRSVKKVVRVGRQEVVLVMRVDQKKGYIDLSKRRVSPEDIARCEERFSKSKRVHQIMAHVARKHNLPLEELYRMIAWPLARKYDHALDGFKEAVVNPEEVLPDLKAPPEIIETLKENLALRLSSHALRLRARVDVRCFGHAGVDAVRAALTAGKEAVQGAKDELRIKLIAPPQYVLVTSCIDKEEGTRRMQKAIETIKNSILQHKGGDFKQNEAITVIGGDDEKLEGEKGDSDDSSDSSSSSDSDDDSGSETDEDEEGMGRVNEEEDREI